MNKKAGIGAIILAIIAAIAGGSWALNIDFSQTTTTDSSTTIGDTITTSIVNELMSSDELRAIGTDIALGLLCDRNPDDPLCE